MSEADLWAVVVERDPAALAQFSSFDEVDYELLSETEWPYSDE